MIQSDQTKMSARSFLPAAAAVAGVTALVSAQPAHASVQEVNDTVAAVGGVAGAAATIVIAAMGVRFAIKQVNRVASKA